MISKKTQEISKTMQSEQPLITSRDRES